MVGAFLVGRRLIGPQRVRLKQVGAAQSNGETDKKKCTCTKELRCSEVKNEDRKKVLQLPASTSCIFIGALTSRAL